MSLQGLPALRLTAPDGAQATVLLQGAQLVSWRTPDGIERLFLSERAVCAEGQAVRGGVPVIFPQFECRGPLPRHGFARQLPWTVLSAEAGPGDALAVLQLQHGPRTREVWPHAFTTELTVRVGAERLDIELAVSNTGAVPWSFTGALHTYLRAVDVQAVRIAGLERLRHLDTVRGTEQIERAALLAIDGEVDRIYFDAIRPLTVTGLADDGRRLRIDSAGFEDAVVWNPGPHKAAALADMEDGGHRWMVCVEAARIGTPVQMEPGAEWVGRQSLQWLADEDAPDGEAAP